MSHSHQRLAAQTCFNHLFSTLVSFFRQVPRPPASTDEGVPEDAPLPDYDCVRAILGKASNLKWLLLEFSVKDYGCQHRTALAMTKVAREVDGTLTGWSPAYIYGEFVLFMSAPHPRRPLRHAEMRKGPNVFFYTRNGLL
jgi:hypothetical protein